MSALQQLLQQHSADIDARIQHTNDIDNEISDRKANTLEEKFQNAKDSIEAVGAELGTAGGAFHMGRKVYTKYKQRQARLAKEKTSGGDSASSESAERPNLDKSSGNQETRAATGETDEPAPAQPEELARGSRASARQTLDTIAEDPNTPVREAASEAKSSFEELPADSQAKLDAQFKNDPNRIENPQTADDFSNNLNIRQQAVEQEKGRLRSQAQSAEEAKDPETHTQPKPSESQPAQDTSNTATAEGQESRAATVESNQAEAPTGTEEANPMEALNTRTNTPLQAGGSEPATPATSEANVGSAAEGAAEEGGARSATAATTQAGGSTAADVEEGARAFMDPATGAAKSAANIASRAADNSSIIDKGINGAKKVGSAIKGGLGGDLSEGSSILPEVGEALDFLGPIGEFAGLITGLVGLFEGIGHKKAEPKTISGQSGGVALQQAGAGIDTSALLSQAPKALMGAV